jgi:hypothetical protein
MFLACVSLLWVSGAFHAEFGEDPDEPSHYIAGLMVRDYIASGAPMLPMRFAEDYYFHYPKVALGHYPPFLYMVEAAWMLVFPVSRPSLLLLNAVLTALAATLVAQIVRKCYGIWAGVGAGLLLLALPLVQRWCGVVMAEPLSFCLSLGALIFCGRYFETGRWSDAAWFGVLAAFALLTKQVTLFLALVPPIAVLLTREFRLLKRPSFWLPALIVVALATPWYLFSMRYFSVRLGSMAALSWKRAGWLQQLLSFVHAEGFTLTVLSSAGLWALVIQPLVRRRPVQGKWAVFAASIFAFQIFRQFAPAATESRHLINIQPAMVVFFAGGIAWILEAVLKPGGRRVRWATAFALLAGAAVILESFEVPQRRYYGFSEAASRLSTDPRLRDEVFFICSDASGEGAFIAEVAAREQRPGHIILRGNKMLATVSWGGAIYSSLFQTPDDVMKYMESVPVRVLVVGTEVNQPRRRHERLTEEMIRRYPDRWSLIDVYPKLRPPSAPGARLRAYRLISQEGKPRSNIRIDLRQRLGKFIGN